MVHHLEAIFENGVFRPIVPVKISEHARVRLVVQEEPIIVDDEDTVRQQRAAFAELAAELAKIPDQSPDDGFTAADHDRILYGRPA